MIVANVGGSSNEPVDSGPGFQMAVRICGAAVIGAMFLAFMRNLNIIEFGSGLADAIGAVGIGTTVENLFGGPTMMGAITNAFLTLGFILFPLLGISMLLRGKYRGGPLTFVILYNAAGWALVHFFGKEIGIYGEFFGIVGIGYWLACAALFLPLIAMFFLDKSI